MGHIAFRRIAVAVRPTLAILVLLALAIPARAQSAWCRFPDPVSSGEMTAILARIGVPAEDRDATMRAFEAYLETVGRIGREQIEPFCSETSTTPANDERELERRIATRLRIAGEILRAETTLAEAIEAAAGQEREIRARLERDRLERRHWMQMVGNRFERRDGAEFVEWFAERGLEPDAETIDLLRARSAETTALWRKLAGLAAREPIEFRRANEAAGLTRPDGSEPGAWERYFETMNRIRAEATAPQGETRRQIRKNQRETARLLATRLSPERAAELHAWFLERSYPTLAMSRNPVPPLVAEAERKRAAGEIDDAALATVRERAATHATRRAELDAKLMDEIDAGTLAGGGAMLFGIANLGNDAPDRTEELLAERGRIDDAAVADLRAAAPALAPPAEVGRISPRIMVGGMALQLDEAALAGGGAFVIQADLDGVVGGGVAMVAMGSEIAVGRAKPISREDLAAWSRRLGVPDESMPLLEMLLEDYRGGYAEIENGPLAELGKAAGPFGNPELPVARRGDLQREATERLLALDAEFFANLAAALTGIAAPDAVARIARERQRSVHRAGMTGNVGFNSVMTGETEPFDLVTTVAEAGLSAETIAGLEASLVAYDAEMTPLLATSYARHAAAARTAAIEQERFMKVVEEDRQAGTVRAVIGSSDDLPEAQAMERQRAAEAEIAAVEAAIRAAQDAAVARALAAVAAGPTGDDRTRLEDALDRATYPRLFRDGRSAEPRFEAALALPDLAGDRRPAVEAAFASWRAEWRRITGAMVESRRRLAAEAASLGKGANAMPLLVANQEAMQRLRFERSEANEKAMRDLKALLTAEQATKVGDLPPAPKRGPMMFGG